jgi:non-ribosomal peptide synthetase component E (peptide arylation enzyme)
MSKSRVVERVPGPGRIGRVAAGDILHRAARHLPDHPALIGGERQTTYAELEAMANRPEAQPFLDRTLRATPWHR